MLLSWKAQGNATHLAGAPTDFSKFRHEATRLTARRVLGLAPIAVMIHSVPEKGHRASTAPRHRLPTAAWAHPEASEQRGAEIQQEHCAFLTIPASSGNMFQS